MKRNLKYMNALTFKPLLQNWKWKSKLIFSPLMSRFRKEISLVTLSPTPHRFNWFVLSRIVLTNTHDLVKAIISTLEQRCIDFLFTIFIFKHQ